MKTTSFQSSMNETAKDMLKTLEDASRPGRPETDNHETGFWKGMAITAGVVAIGVFALIPYVNVIIVQKLFRMACQPLEKHTMESDVVPPDNQSQNNELP